MLDVTAVSPRVRRFRPEGSERPRARSRGARSHYCIEALSRTARAAGRDPTTRAELPSLRRQVPDGERRLEATSEHILGSRGAWWGP